MAILKDEVKRYEMKCYDLIGQIFKNFQVEMSDIIKNTTSETGLLIGASIEMVTETFNLLNAEAEKFDKMQETIDDLKIQNQILTELFNKKEENTKYLLQDIKTLLNEIGKTTRETHKVICRAGFITSPIKFFV